MSSDEPSPSSPFSPKAIPSVEPSEPLVVKSKKIESESYPDLDMMQIAVLKDGPRAKKNAKYTVIRNRHTKEIHHGALVIETRRSRKGQWNRDDEHTICLTDEDGDEIGKLRDFLNALHSGAMPKANTDYVVLPAPSGTDPRAWQNQLEEATASGKIDIFADILKRALVDSDLFRVLLERAAKDRKLFTEAAAALNLGAYQNSVAELEMLIATDDVKESSFQTLLTKNPWMFGSEYSELLDRRKWTRDENQDFVVRRTADNYIELIEIKTPLAGTPLFNFDRSHESFYAGAELSKVIGQVQKYLEKLDADRHSILAQDHEDTAKIRAKVIIGRDVDDNQRKALRGLNGHLHRIEILTFDQLVRIARHVLNYLENAMNSAPVPSPSSPQ